MAEKKKELRKCVIVEFDFTAIDGAKMLFDITKRYLANLDGIPFDERIEAKYLAGGNCQGALAGYFAAVKTKKTAQKAARELSDEFAAAVEEAAKTKISQGFRNFVKTLADKGVLVVIATRADLEKVKPAFAGIVGENVMLYHEESKTYGTVKWDAWRRACVAARVRHTMTVAVTGSGLGVKSALQAGMGSIAVINDHVAYQDFSGVNEIVKELNAATAKTALELLRV
ncbi:MAG: hypothetical protein ILO34_01665 [Kiritimatiellae bacterium]|nr:hypothetical protein [Kiritimatiellia bacterium]